MIFELNDNLNSFLKIILKNAQEQNLRVFFVGGIVRDNLLGISTKDIDLLLLGDAILFSQKLPECIDIKSIHKDFATVKLSYNGIDIDIASSRLEKYPYSGVLPVVEKVGVGLNQDVLRRDFTLNSLYCELKLLNDNIDFTLIDMVNGVEDLKAGVLRSLHNKSYIDDPTRIIRGVEFKYRFNFMFSFEDEKMIENYLGQIDYANMSMDRNFKVIKRALSTRFADEIFKEIILKKYYKIVQKQELYIDFSLINKIFEKIHLNKEQKAQFYILMLKNEAQNKKEFSSKVEIFRDFQKLGLANLAYYFYKTQDESVNLYLKIKNVDVQISGNDLINLGYNQGKLIGIILNDLLEYKFNNLGALKTKNDEIEWVLKSFPKK